jgi:hypothetical protein
LTEEISSDRRLEKLPNEELHNLYSLPSVVRMFKLRMIGVADLVAGMRRRGIYVGFCGKYGRKETTRKTKT